MPGYHSFICFGSLSGSNTKLIYTAPAKTLDFDEDGTKLSNISIHVKELNEEPWIWVLDCSHMEMKHYTEISFTIGLLDILANDKNLRAVWILRPNVWIKTTVGFLQTFYSAKILSQIEYFDGSNMELMDSLQKTGANVSTIYWLISQIS